MILLIDNYDSFVHNLARYLEELGTEPLVARNDALSIAEIRRLAPQAIVLSPGPCTPHEAGITLDVIRELGGEIPLLGVCLGHQAIGVSFGAKLRRAREPVHGRTSLVEHSGVGLFESLPQPMRTMRYHSLVLEDVVSPLRVTARTIDGIVMAVEHEQLPIWGVQFHPESVLTDGGHQLLSNFLHLAGVPHQPYEFIEYRPPALDEDDFYRRPVSQDATPRL
ncbi:MAG: aminodeoxychorismate/anthranilate synthase component II [Planctomycetaceae bacterium]